MDPVGPHWVEPGAWSFSGANVLTAELRAYLSATIVRYDRLNFGDPSEYLSNVYGTEFPQVSLLEVWTPPLVTATAASDGSAPWRVQAGAETPLHEVLSSRDQMVHVLLAGAGVGKSTACQQLCCELAKRVLAANEIGPNSPIPIYVPLRGLKPSDRRAEAVISAAATAALGSIPNREAMDESLAAQLPHAYVMLDGLDELGTGENERTLLDQVNQYVGFLVDGYPTMRLLVTCRDSDYVGENRLRIRDVPIIIISRFSPTQVTDTIRKWHRAAMSIGARSDRDLSTLERRANTLTDAIEADEGIAELARTPLFLNIMQLVFEQDHELPRSVSRLCDRAVNFLMFERPRQRGSERATAPDALAREGQILRVLELLAFEMHAGVDRSGQTDLRIARVVDLALPAIGADTARGFRENGHLLHSIISQILEGNGVLMEARPGTITYTHAVFREVLAGRVVGSLPADELSTLAENEHWHAPLRYWAGLYTTREGTTNVMAIAEELLERYRQGRATVAALVIAAEIFEVVRSNLQGRPTAIVERMHRLLVAALSESLRSTSVELTLRLRIGGILGRLGDPRIPVQLADYAQLPRWTKQLAEGRFRIGRTTPHRSTESKFQLVPCSPRRVVPVPAFAISTYPVTNQEFRLFVESDGYADASHWDTAEAQLWRTGDEDFLARLAELVERTAPTHFKTRSQRGRRMTDPDVATQRLLRRQEPLFWGSPLFSQPNQPVVGINWWEARAYCTWLTGVVRAATNSDTVRIDLPSEFEWERSGRPSNDDRPFPWGDEQLEGSGLFGFVGESVTRPGSVGLFPWMAWPDGPQDLIGNVWEWTRSRPLPYDSTAEPRDDIQGIDDRAVRGSSWLSREKESWELTFRSFDPPCNAYEDLGFRFAVHDDGGDPN